MKNTHILTLYISLGANIGRREDTIRRAVKALDGRIGALVGCSSLYETRPVGFSSENLFLNAVAAYDTTLPPDRLLAETQAVERELGRTQKSVNGIYHDRPIDIDLLLLGDTVLSRADITLPHPHMAERRFVMQPLAELAPALRHPVTGQTMSELLAALDRPVITRPREADTALLAAINALLPQLSRTAVPLTEDSLRRLLATETTRLYTVSDTEGVICGMATLCLCTSPTGTKAWIEDVVIDCRARGRGYARALIHHLMSRAATLGAKAVVLTSRPERIAANALYTSCGFRRRETNVYRFKP